MVQYLGNVLQLKEFQSLEIVPFTMLDDSEIYQRKMDIFGNSILSSVFVKTMDPGSTILVRYWDTSSGEGQEERYNLDSHIVITPDMLDPTYGFTHRITVTRIHNKPVCEIIITGGNVEFGVYATVVSTSASDMDQALRSEGQVADFTRDKGLAPVHYDPIENKWYFPRSDHGYQLIKFADDGVVGERVPLRSVDGLMTDADVWVPCITTVVPVGKLRHLHSARVTTTMDCEVQVIVKDELDVETRIGSGRVGVSSPNCFITWKPTELVEAGKEIRVEVRARASSFPRAVEAYLGAVDDSV